MIQGTHLLRRGLGPAIAITLLLALASTASASAFRWSGRHLIDRSAGVTLGSVTCPSSTQCVALDLDGRVLAFNPPSGATMAALGTTSPANGLACASATQCVAIDAGGDELSFDPTHLTSPAIHRVDTAAVASGAEQANAVACASAAECVLVDGSGNAVTFDPASPGGATTASLDPGEDFGLVSIACVSTTQCTAISHTRAVTFNPASPAGATATTIDAGGLLDRLACPAATQCTAVDEDGHELTFDPQSPAPGTPVAIAGSEPGPLLGLACPSATECVATSQDGRAITFDPLTGAVVRTITDPRAGGDVIGQDEGVQAVACLSSTQCIAVDGGGHELSFDPQTSTAPLLRGLDTGAPLADVACPGRGQCTAVDPRRAITFDPLNDHTPHVHVLFSGTAPSIAALGCPTLTECSAVRSGREIRFDPRRIRTAAGHQVSPAHADAVLDDLRCPSRSECVAIDGDGDAVVYDPLTGRRIRPAIHPESDEALVALACPSSTQCTAVDDDGTMVTFQPRTGKRIALAKIDPAVGLDAASGNSDNELDAITCHTTSGCVAVDTLGNLVRFNPRSDHRATPHKADPDHGLTAVACPSSTLCVLGDSAGRTLTGTPGAGDWTVAQLRAAAPIAAVTCVSGTECVAVDEAGDAYTGRR